MSIRLDRKLARETAKELSKEVSSQNGDIAFIVNHLTMAGRRRIGHAYWAQAWAVAKRIPITSPALDTAMRLIYHGKTGAMFTIEEEG